MRFRFETRVVLASGSIKQEAGVMTVREKKNQHKGREYEAGFLMIAETIIRENRGEVSRLSIDLEVDSTSDDLS